MKIDMMISMQQMINKKVSLPDSKKQNSSHSFFVDGRGGNNKFNILKIIIISMVLKNIDNIIISINIKELINPSIWTCVKNIADKI